MPYIRNTGGSVKFKSNLRENVNQPKEEIVKDMRRYEESVKKRKEDERKEEEIIKEMREYEESVKKRKKKVWLYIIILLILALTGFAIYYYFKR